MEIDWTQVGTALAALVVGGGGVALKFRRATSREKVEAAKDEAETSLISRLEHERDEARVEARQVREQRVADASRIARLEAENEDLKRHVNRLVRALPPEQREVYETDFAPICEMPRVPTEPKP